MGPITLEIIIAHGSFSIFSFQLNFLFEFLKVGSMKKLLFTGKNWTCFASAEQK